MAALLLLPVAALGQEGRDEPLARNPGAEFHYYPEGFYRGYLDVIRATTMELPTSKMVSVIGRVAKPCSIPAEAGLTAFKAIERAGGMNEFAKDNRVGIWKNKDGKFLIFNAKKRAADPLAPDPLLEEGDIVVVLQRFIDF